MHIPPEEYATFDKYLDDQVSSIYHEQPLAQDWARIAKIGEEYGEAVQAFIGATGQNPRKGTVGTNVDVINELCDTLFTALLAIQHMTKSENVTQSFIADRWAYRMQKAGLISIFNQLSIIRHSGSK